jgi:hypothetical protein
VAEVAELLGSPLMPWQRHVADVALEVDPDSGLLVYREIALTVPRQSGKTLLLLCLMVHRALGFGQRQRILYTAQTRNDARRKWEDEHVQVLEHSRLRPMFSVRKSNGSEAIRWKNGSMHGITSSTEKAGHGETLDLGVIDEAFAQEDARLEQALKPTMITRPQPQLYVVSTAGSDRSAYLRGKVEIGRRRAELGLAESVAYFEWSAPDKADPADPAVWRACMPALGHTVREEAIAADFTSMDLREFRRAYLNQWAEEVPQEWLVIPQPLWDGLVDAGSAADDPVAFAADITPDRSFGSIATAGRRPDGRMHVEVVDHRPGTGWMAERIVELNGRWNPCAVVVDAAGPAGSLLAELEAAGVEVVKPTSREAAQAAGQLYDLVIEGKLAHHGQPALNAALGGAQRRPLGDAWAWDRRSRSVDISPLVAATLAAWGHATRAHQQVEAQSFFASWR